MSTESTQVVPPPSAQKTVSPQDEKRLLKFALRLLVAAFLIIMVLVATGLWSRAAAERDLAKGALNHTSSRVAVVRPKVSNAVQELVLPASVQAFTEAPIYARTQGYLKQWYFDIGSHVKRGQLLAEIETPEGDQQLAQAQAELKTAQANADLAKTTAERWQNLYNKDAVSKQETDQAVGDYTAKQAAVDALQANVHRLEQLQGFEKVYAPFDGVITARETDIGALVSTGSAKELFHLAAIDKLRVYTSVPEASASAVSVGMDAFLTLDQFPGRTFKGTIARDAGAIDGATRTLNVEIDLDNPAGELRPGAYGFVHLRLPGGSSPLTIPANALVFRAQGPQVAIVRDKHAFLVPITIGRDYGDAVEVTSGLTKDSVVILDASDALVDDTPVEIEAGS